MTKYARLEFRLDKNVKEIIKKAADLINMPVSKFVINASYSHALEFLKNHKTLADFVKQNEEDNKVIAENNNGE